MRRIVGRLFSPAGFLLVLLFFLLPFASVSCEVFGAEIGADYTGLDMATNGEPDATIPEGFDGLGADAAKDEREMREDAPPTDVQPWTILAAAVVAAGLLTALIAAARARMIAAASIAGLGVVLLIVNQIIAHQHLYDRLWAERPKAGAEDFFGFEITPDLINQMVKIGIGFWLAVVVLAMVVLGNVGGLTYDKWQRFLPARAAEAPTAASPPPDAPTPPAGFAAP